MTVYAGIIAELRQLRDPQGPNEDDAWREGYNAALDDASQVVEDWADRAVSSSPDARGERTQPHERQTVSRYRSRNTVAAYYRDGTPETDAAIVSAVKGAEVVTGAGGEPRLMVPGLFSTCQMPIGWWIYQISQTQWELRIDSMFRRDYEVRAGAA